MELLLMTRTHQHMDGGRATQLFETCREGGSLHIAAVRGDLALARKLLTEGADVRIGLLAAHTTFLMHIFVAFGPGRAKKHGAAPRCAQRSLSGR